MSRLLRLAAATGAVVTPLIAFHGVASAHSNTVTCTDQAISTWRITNDYPLSESFTSPQGPAGNVAAGNGSYTDVIYVGDSLQIDAVWSDGFTESRTGTGDCTPEGGTTTTTELVTTTTEQETTTSTTSTTSTTPTSTTETPTSTSTTTIPQSTTTVPADTSTTTSPTTSSSVASTSTTSEPASTTAPAPTTTSTSPPAPSSTTPECSDNPNTPTDDCAPICQPVTQPDGTNSCYRLPATGADVGWLIVPAFMMLLCGAATVICGRRR